MKQNILIALLVGALTTGSLAYATQHRDGCKEFGDPCNCGGLKGFCLTGWMSNPPDQLYCDCNSDVYSEDEMISFMIKDFCSKDNELRRSIIRNDKSLERSAKILDEMFKILGTNPTDAHIAAQVDIPAKIQNQFELIESARKKALAPFKKTTTNKSPTAKALSQVEIKTLQGLREELKRTTRMEKIMPMFFFTDGVCSYINQECTCSNTGRKGVCSARRDDPVPQIICHCD